MADHRVLDGHAAGDARRGRFGRRAAACRGTLTDPAWRRRNGSRRGCAGLLACHLPLELRNILEAREIDEDEALRDEQDRLKDLGLEVQGAGYGKSVTDAAVQHEWYVRHLVALWRKEVNRAGSQMGLS